MSETPGATPPDLPSGNVQPGAEQRPSSSDGCGKAAGIGCSVLVVLVIVAGFVLYTQWRGWFVQAARFGTGTFIEQLTLPPDQLDQIREQVDGFFDDFEKGDVTLEQLQVAVLNITQGPLAFRIIDKAFVQPSGLSEEEKSEGSRTLERIARGVKEDRFSSEDLEKLREKQIAIAEIADQQDKDAGIREILAEFKKLADQANIPDEPFELDVAEEVRIAIEDARAGGE